MDKLVLEKSSQPKPYSKPLPYHVCYSNFRADRDGSYIAPGHSSATVQILQPHYGLGPAVNKALDKLYDEFQRAEDLMVAWKERQKAIDMIADGVGTLVRTARAIRRRDPKIIRRILNKNALTKRDIATTPAGLWLQYHFAIVPTIMDVHHAAGVLGEPFPLPEIEITSGHRWSLSEGTIKTPLVNSWEHHGTYSGFVKIGGKLRSINPNIGLASRLGFGQPLSVAWEMTPFSWFVDYFVNVGQLINNLQPRFPGFDVVDKYTTYTTTGSCYGFLNSADGWGWYPPSNHYSGTGKGTKRVTTWPDYELQFSSPLDLSGQRCSYIVAVLVGLLSGMRK